VLLQISTEHGGHSLVPGGDSVVMWEADVGVEVGILVNIKGSILGRVE